MGHRCRSKFRHERVRVEALERKRRDQLWRLACRHQLGERGTDDRRRLEAVRPPAAGDEEAVQLRPPEDGAVVGAQIAESGPLAQDAKALELWEELERVTRGAFEEREGARPV